MEMYINEGVCQSLQDIRLGNIDLEISYLFDVYGMVQHCIKCKHYKLSKRKEFIRYQDMETNIYKRAIKELYLVIQ